MKSAKNQYNNLCSLMGKYDLNKIKDLKKDQSKLYTGILSPGCITCIEGSWACIFFNHLCSRRCFFCPQNRERTKEHKPLLDGVYFDRVDNCLDFIEKFKFKGIAFSGGEPLMAFNLLLEYIQKIKKKFGSKMYIWLYTNGDLVDKRKLKLLKNAGLDEIRFNLSARKYDFRPIILAKRIIGNVVIETPAIPEEKNQLIKALFLMEKYKITRLNMHELITTKYNKKEFINRGYKFKNNNGVINSDLTALKIFKFILDKKIDISLNYCTTVYKNRYQGKGINIRYAPYCSEYFETITKTGHIRQIYVTPDSVWIKNFTKQNLYNNKKYYFWDRTNFRLYLHPYLLKKINREFLENQNIYINYFHALVKNNTGKTQKGSKTLKIGEKFSILLYRKKCKQMILKKEAYLYVFITAILKETLLSNVIKKMLSTSSYLRNLSLKSYSEKLGDLLAFYRLFEEVEFLRKTVTSRN